jgi:predicted ATPase
MWPRANVRAMGSDRITEITIEGLRCIERLTLPLHGLTVLIGENGSGKSSIVEACEVLRRVPAAGFYGDLMQIHGGPRTLLRHGAGKLQLGVSVDGDGGEPPLRYEISMSLPGPAFRGGLTLGERFTEAEGRVVFERDGDDLRGPEVSAGARLGYPAEPLLNHYAGSASSRTSFMRMQRALASIEVHLPFDVFPTWAARAHARPSVMRGSMLLQPTDQLDRLGGNIANAYNSLRVEHDDEHWRTTMDYVRLGLGDRVEGVNTRPDASGGSIALWLKIKNQDAQIPAAGLSDGTLSYLAFVALYRLRRARSLLVFDEPDLHLHPAMLARVTGFFEAMAADGPVVITTHSDRLLDTLRDPAAVVRVCELEEPEATTRVRALDREALSAWLDEYRGVGELRSAGYLHAVLRSEEPR